MIIATGVTPTVIIVMVIIGAIIGMMRAIIGMRIGPSIIYT